jgi:multidrug efflux pump subunit AcrA (membrane-fusion protein)
MGSVPSSLLRRAYGLVPIGLVAGLSLVWASRPTVPVLVRGMGLLAPPEARRGFYARGPGEVQALLVTVGQSVRPGQKLATLSRVSQNAAGAAQAGTAPGPQATTARLAALTQQLQVLKVQDRAFVDQQTSLVQRRHQIATTNRPVRSQLEALEALRKDEVIARYSPLWVGAQDLELRNKADLASVEASLSQLRAQRAGAPQCHKGEGRRSAIGLWLHAPVCAAYAQPFSARRFSRSRPECVRHAARTG